MEVARSSEVKVPVSPLSLPNGPEGGWVVVSPATKEPAAYASGPRVQMESLEQPRVYIEPARPAA